MNVAQLIVALEPLTAIATGIAVFTGVTGSVVSVIGLIRQGREREETEADSKLREKVDAQEVGLSYLRESLDRQEKHIQAQDVELRQTKRQLARAENEIYQLKVRLTDVTRERDETKRRLAVFIEEGPG